MFGAAEATREEIGTRIDPSSQADYERKLATLRDTMGPEAFVVAWSAGRAMTLDQAVEYALGKQSGAGDVSEEKSPAP